MLFQSYQLPNCNLFTQHLSLVIGELPLVQIAGNPGPSLIIIYSFYMSLEVVSTIFWCHCSHITATAAVLLLLLLSYYCCFHITPVTSAFPGAAELTTQLLRLISILCLPLCRINKFGFYFPRRLLRSRILVGHQDYFLAPLPGRHSSTHKFTWGVHSTSLSVFILFCFVQFIFVLFYFSYIPKNP